jgi:aspartyl-tRNA(Asn)/glutamyl-tRNA(Gln) amidotransferase subunit B
VSLSADWEVVVGLEVHAQLATESKIFSRAPVAFGQSPNSQVNEICSGMPGALPVLNRGAVELAIRAGLALNCDIRKHSVFARKNYFYPDLPKGYQISQFEEPICVGGAVPFEWDGDAHEVALTRIHMEEDAGKSFHEGDDPHSHIDLNRAGTPLIEIVSEPDIRSGREAAAYFRELREILVALGVNDGNMAEGSLRCDANISVRKHGESAFRTRVEVKNLNSFRFLRDAVEYEAERQIDAYLAEEEIFQETRLWDDERKQTYSMREKEGSADYRYFPDPDLPPLLIESEWIDEIRRQLPELPGDSRERLVTEHNLSIDDARTIVSQRGFLTIFDRCLDNQGMDPEDVSRWLLGQVAAASNAQQLEWDGAQAAFISDAGHLVDEQVLHSLQKLIDGGTINLRIARDVFSHLLQHGGTPETIVRDLGLEQVSDDTVIDDAIRAAAEENPEEAQALRNGKQKLIGFFIGQVMRKTGGKANPGVVRERIEAILRD